METPEGVDLHLTPAGPPARALAWAIDALLRLLILIAALIPLSLLGAAGRGLFLFIFFAVSWLYPILFETLAHGVTPGKRSLGLRVVHDDGTPVGWPASIVRNLLRAVDSLPVGYAAGLITTLVSRDFRRLGDLAAGTVVVHAEGPGSPAAIPEAEPIPLPAILTNAEQRAIVDFAERVPLLTRERAAEIAALAEPLTGGQQGVRKLTGYAAWIVGRR